MSQEHLAAVSIHAFNNVSAGLSEKAVQRKATCRALFSKMLYLIENEQIMDTNDVLSVDILRNVRPELFSHAAYYIMVLGCQRAAV